MISARRRPRRLGLKVLMLAAAAFAVLPATDAFAGRLLVTGHDWDLHCSGGGTPATQCHYVKVGVKFVRAGSSKKVLILDDTTSGEHDVSNSLDFAFGPGFPRKEVDPKSNAWKTLGLTTKKFSAILVASDTTCGGCDLNGSGNVVPDSKGINKRSNAIHKFFNKGGGLMYGAGAQHGDGSASNGPDIFYNSVPIPVGGTAVSPPFKLTKVGRKIGFKDNPSGNNDINCCATHNSFKIPKKGGALKVAEKDNAGKAETLIAKGKIAGGAIVSGGGKLHLTVKPRRTREDRRTCFAFKVTNPNGKPVRRATVHFAGTRDRTNRKGRARICATFSNPGRQRAKATKKGFTPDRATVRVVRAPGFTG